MKKRVLLFSLSALAGYFMLSSYSNGIGGQNPNNDYTGYNNTTCANCHGGSSTTTTASFSLVDKATSQPVTNYMYTPGKVYTVTLKGVNSGSLYRFGFQAEPLTSTGTAAGTLTATASNHHVVTMNGGRMLIENTSRITATATNLAATFDWTAPASGTGPVTFYGEINATNGNGTNGDAPSPGTTMALVENTAGIETVNNNATINIFPNPTIDNINVSLEGLQSGNYTLAVYSLNGQQVVAKNILVNGAKTCYQLHTAELTTGMYQLVLSADGWHKAISFLKN